VATDLKSLSLKELYNNKAIFSKVIGTNGTTNEL
jgi:hypothetical protein